MEECGNYLINNPLVRKTAKIHRYHNCCCWFGTSNFGFNVITIGLILGLVEEYVAPNPARGLIKLACILPFAVTYFPAQDTADTRKVCLYTFCLAMPIIAIINLVTYQNILIDNVAFAKELCWFNKKWIKMFGSEKDQEEECAENDDDCEAAKDQCPILPGGVLKVLFIITPLVVIINVHFMFVLYAHWQNSRLPESQGGCGDERGHHELEEEDD